MTMTSTPDTLALRPESSLLTAEDLHLFNEGTHYRAYDKLGAHLAPGGQGQGTHFAVWAPNAREVSVIGSFNDWNPRAHSLHARGSSGIWEDFLPEAGKGSL